MTWVKSFGFLFVVQALLWGGAHFYLNENPKQVLVVVDTSYAMKPYFSNADSWLSDFERRTRYADIRVGTDKAEMGRLKDLPSRDVLFRTAFGRLSTEKLRSRYSNSAHIEKYLLTSEPVQLTGWHIIDWR